MRLDDGVPSIIKVNKMGKTCMRWNRIGWRHIVILNKVTNIDDSEMGRREKIKK